MLPMGSIFLPFIVASFKNGVLYVEIHYSFTVFFAIQCINTNTLRVHFHLLLMNCVTVFCDLMFWRLLLFLSIESNKNTQKSLLQ